jgi:hypothetical protein
VKNLLKYPRAVVVDPTSIKNPYLPGQKCPPNPGLHTPHLPVVFSHAVSSRLLPHLHCDSQKSPKNPGLHRPHIPVVFSHAISSRLLLHLLHCDSQKSPKNPGLHNPH